MKKVKITYNNGKVEYYNNTIKLYIEDNGLWLSIYYNNNKGFKTRDILPTTGIINIQETSTDTDVPKINF